MKQMANTSFRRRQGHYNWVLLAISLGLFSWVLWYAGLSELIKYLRAADYSLILLAIPIPLVGLMLRAIRWRLLLLPLGCPSIAVSFSSMMLGYLANNLLPMRAGEVVRAYGLGQRTSISKSAVLATIVVERLVDGVVMILVLSLLFHVFPMPNWLRFAAIAGGALFSGTAIALIIARRRPKRPVEISRAFLSRLPSRWQLQGASLVDNFLLGLTSFRSSTDALNFLLLTVAIWGAEILWFWMVMRAFGISLPVFAVALVVAAGAVATMIPASPGYVGTYEFVLVSVLTVLGLLVAPATAFAVAIHGLTWLITSLIGAVCTLNLGVSLKPTYGGLEAEKLGSTD